MLANQQRHLEAAQSRAAVAFKAEQRRTELEASKADDVEAAAIRARLERELENMRFQEQQRALGLSSAPAMGAVNSEGSIGAGTHGGRPQAASCSGSGAVAARHRRRPMSAQR